MGPEENSPLKNKKVLVTGGGGFVGTSIVRRLLDLGARTSILGRNRYPHFAEFDVHQHTGSISDLSTVIHACRGIDLVFHVAAKAGIWGKWQDYYETNVTGTRNVLRACLENGIGRLVYTSTPSVTFNQRDITGEGEAQLPYPTRFLCHYAKSKVIAEREVLAANGNKLSATALRPHLIWGPNDPHLLPRLVERGRAGELRIIGSGTNLVDLTYIDNVAHAHILAAENLLTSAGAAGQAYFISDGAPVNLWQWINNLFAEMEIARIDRKVPFSIAYFAGMLLEGAYRVIASGKEPKMTRFLAEQLAKNHYFSIEKAQKDLHYAPIVTVETGMQRTIKWLKNHVENIV